MFRWFSGCVSEFDPQVHQAVPGGTLSKMDNRLSKDRLLGLHELPLADMSGSCLPWF